MAKNGSEKRKSPRRTLRYPAKLDLGYGPIRACILFDISKTGAKLITPAPREIPYRFTLLLGNGARECRVVWRGDKAMGVEFLPPTVP